jgi:hypothetical protein
MPKEPRPETDAPRPKAGKDVKGNSLEPIQVNARGLIDLAFADFVATLLAELEELKDKRFNWYDQLRDRRYGRVHFIRYSLAWLGTVAIVFTAIGGLIRIFAPHFLDAYLKPSADVWAFGIAIFLYAMMGAILFFEKATDNTSAYFRHLATTLAIRDLWTRLQFAFLKELMANKADNAETRERLRLLAESFCNDLDKLGSDEITQWRTESLTSLSELEASAKAGTEEVRPNLKTTAKAHDEKVPPGRKRQ